MTSLCLDIIKLWAAFESLLFSNRLTPYRKDIDIAIDTIATHGSSPIESWNQKNQNALFPPILTFYENNSRFTVCLSLLKKNWRSNFDFIFFFLWRSSFLNHSRTPTGPILDLRFHFIQHGILQIVQFRNVNSANLCGFIKS